MTRHHCLYVCWKTVPNILFLLEQPSLLWPLQYNVLTRSTRDLSIGRDMWKVVSRCVFDTRGRKSVDFVYYQFSSETSIRLYYLPTYLPAAHLAWLSLPPDVPSGWLDLEPLVVCLLLPSMLVIAVIWLINCTIITTRRDVEDAESHRHIILLLFNCSLLIIIIIITSVISTDLMLSGCRLQKNT